MKRIYSVLAVLVALSMMFSAGAAVAADQLTVNGSTTVLPIAQKAAEDFMKKHPEIAISVAGTGSGDGIKALIDGTTDVANASRAMKSSEMELAKGKGVNPMAHVVALDCIVPIINPANPVSDLSIDQLRDIYMGKIKNWKEVGGEDREIVAVSRDSSSGTFEVWEEKIMKKEKVRPDAQMQASNGAVAQAVAGNKFAIGYVGIGYLNDQIKGVKVNGVMASKATALDKSYPVARELYMYTNGEPQGKAKAYIDFILSAEGQKIAEEEGFVAAR